MFGSTSTEDQPILIVKSGSNLNNLQSIKVNSNQSNEFLKIDSDSISAKISVRILDFKGPQDGSNGDNPYPQPGGSGAEGGGSEVWTYKENATWSILVQLRFKQIGNDDGMNVNDLMWGNIWKNPIKSHLPPGTSIITKFMKMRDPSVDFDLYADEPWAFLPELNPSLPIEEDITHLFRSNPANAQVLVRSLGGAAGGGNRLGNGEAGEVGEGVEEELKKWIGEPKFRKEFMGDEKRSEGVVLGDDMVVTAEFAHGHIDFKTLSIKLPLLPTVGLSKYWDGQPITFCLRNKKTGEDYLVVTFEIGSDSPPSSSTGAAE